MKLTLNDNCDAIFKTFSTVFSLAFMLNCFTYMVSRYLPKYAYKLNTFKIKEIEKDLIQIGDLAYE